MHLDGHAPHPLKAESVIRHVSGSRRVLGVGPMKGRSRVPAPAPGRGGRGRSVLMRGGVELSAATNQRAGVGWLPNGGRVGAAAPPLRSFASPPQALAEGSAASERTIEGA